MGRLPGIDGLRAVAVLCVVAYHAGFPAGFVGVDVFFVISGYLITRILVQDGDLLVFYARRARRILPAAFLVVLVTTGLSFLLLPSPSDVARSAAAAGVFVANLHFQSVTGGYWSSDAASMPLLHLWSLSVEEQFYLLWPVVLIFARKRPSVLWWVFGSSLALYAWWSYADPKAAFYQTPARAWELTAGALVAVAGIRHSRISSAGLPLVLAACLLPMPVPVATVLAVLGATLVCANAHAGASTPLLEARPVVLVGLMSYSLYLWHWPLLAIDRALRVGESPLSVKLSLVGVAFVLSILSYRYVEQPFRKARIRPKRTVAIGVACAAALSCTAFVMADSPMPVVHVSATAQCRTGSTLQPMRCVGSGPKVVLWGDSYAGAWSGYAETLAAQQGVPAVRAITTSCPPATVAVPRTPKGDGEVCRQRAEETLAYLRTKGADTLIVSGHWARMLRERPAAGEAVILGIGSLSNVRRIIVIGATPEVLDSVEKCEAVGKPCDIPRAQYERSASATKRMTARLALLPNVEVWDLGDWMCDSEKCPGVRNGIRLYFHDNHHVSVEAVDAYLKR